MPPPLPPPPKRNWGPRLGLLGVFAITGLSIFGGELLLAPDADENRAPPLGLTDLDGAPVEVNADDLPTVLLFTAAGCSPCAADLESVEAASQRWRDKVTFVTVAPAPQSEVAGVVDRLDLRQDVASDDDGAAARRYRVDVEKASTFVFVSAAGSILDRQKGPIGADKLERRIRSLISVGPKPD